MPGHQAQSHDDDATKTVNDVPNASDAKSTQGSSHGDKAVTDEAPSTDIGDGGDAAQDAPAESKKDTYGDKSDAGEDTVDNQDDIARSSLMQELFARLKAHEVPGKSTDDYGPEDLASIFGHEVMAHHSEAGSNPVSEESRVNKPHINLNLIDAHHEPKSPPATKSNSKSEISDPSTKGPALKAARYKSEGVRTKREDDHPPKSGRDPHRSTTGWASTHTHTIGTRTWTDCEVRGRQASPMRQPRNPNPGGPIKIEVTGTDPSDGECASSCYHSVSKTHRGRSDRSVVQDRSTTSSRLQDDTEARLRRAERKIRHFEILEDERSKIATQKRSRAEKEKSPISLLGTSLSIFDRTLAEAMKGAPNPGALSSAEQGNHSSKYTFRGPR